MGHTQARPGPGLPWKDIKLPTREPSRARQQVRQQPEQLQDPEPTPPPDLSKQAVSQYPAQAQVQQEEELQAEVQQGNPVQQPVKRGPGRSRKRKLSPSAKHSHVKVQVVPTAAQAEYLRSQQIQSQDGRQSLGGQRTAVPVEEVAVDGGPAPHQTGRQVQRFPNNILPQPNEVKIVGYVQPRVGLDQSFFAPAQHSRESSYPSHVPSRYQQAVQQQRQQQQQRLAVQSRASLTVPNAAQQASSRLPQELQAPWSFPPAQAKTLRQPQTQTQQIAQINPLTQPDPPAASLASQEIRPIAIPQIRSTRKRQPKPSLKVRENAELEQEQVSLISQQSRAGSQGRADKGDQLANSSLGDCVRDARPRARESRARESRARESRARESRARASRARDKGKGIALDSLAPVHLERVGAQIIGQNSEVVGVDIGGAKAEDVAEERYEPFPLLDLDEEGEMTNKQRGPAQLITSNIVDPGSKSDFQARGATADSTPALCSGQRQQHPKPRNQTCIQPEPEPEPEPEPVPEPEPEPGPQPKPESKSSSQSHSRPRRLTHTASQCSTLPHTTTRWWELGLKTFTEYDPHTGTSSDHVILRSGVAANTLAYWYDRALCDIASRFQRSRTELPEICLRMLRVREQQDIGKMVTRQEAVALVVGRGGRTQRPVLELLPLHRVHFEEGQVVVAVVVGEMPPYGTKPVMTAEGKFEEKTAWDVLLEEVKVEGKVWKDFRRWKAFEALSSDARLAKLEYVERELEGRLNLGQQPADAVLTRWMRKVEIEKVVPPGTLLRSKPVEEMVQVDGRMKMKMVFAQFQVPVTVQSGLCGEEAEVEVGQ